MSSTRDRALAAQIDADFRFAFAPSLWTPEGAWATRHAGQILAAIEDAVARSPEWAGQQEAELRAAIRPLLRESAAPRNQPPLPCIPMTLEDLLGMEPPARRNPAPLPVDQRLAGDWAPEALQQIGMNNESEARRWAYETAWAMTAPEGCPPYPRRGATYSKDEARELDIWKSHVWPLPRLLAERYIDPLARGVHPSFEALTEAAITASKVPAALRSFVFDRREGFHNAVAFHWDADPINRPMAAAGKTPQEWADALCRYAYNKFRPVVVAEAYMRRYPDMFQRHDDPDAHMQRLLQTSQESGLWSEDDAKTYLWNLYVRDGGVPVSFLPEPYRSAEAGRADRPFLSPWTSAPLSVQIAARDKHRAEREREARERQEREAAERLARYPAHKRSSRK